jgi:hypothetical protein
MENLPKLVPSYPNLEHLLEPPFIRIGYAFSIFHLD